MQRRSLLISAGAMPALWSVRARAEEPAWLGLREQLFAGREIADGGTLLRFDAPQRAADAAVVPLTVEALVPQRDERWIRSTWLVIDENPAPLAGVFHFQPYSGLASIATRVRVNSYTPIHAVAETSDGRLWSVERFVKAAGGCSAPGLKDAQEAMARLGRMKLKTVNPFAPGDLMRVQLLISHPNYTGMQMDQVSRNWIPPDYVQRVEVSFAGRPVLEVEGDISLSEDPSITFAFVPERAGELTAAVADSDGREFSQSWPIGPSS